MSNDWAVRYDAAYEAGLKEGAREAAVRIADHMLRAKELAEYRASTKIEDPDHWDELKNKW